MSEQAEAGIALALATLMMLCALLAYYLERSKTVWVTESGAAMVLGMVCGGIWKLADSATASKMSFDDSNFFIVLLPPIILEAGFSMKKKKFFANLSTILLLAVVGTVIATIVTGAILGAAGYFASTAEAFVYAALISAVDPVATLSVFKKVGAPEQLFNVVFGESVLNDAVAIVLYRIFLERLNDTDDSFTASTVTVAALKLVGIGLGSLIMAALFTLPTAYIIRHINRRHNNMLQLFPDLEIALVLLSTFMGYLITDLCELSGIVSIFFSGVLTSHYLVHNLSKAAQSALTHVLHMLAFLAENFVFIYLGLSVFTVAPSYEWNAGLLVLNLVVLLLARALNSVPLIWLANLRRRTPIPWKHVFVIWFAGLRGAIAYALALSYSPGAGVANKVGLIRSTTMFTVVFTTLVLGVGTAPLLKWLELDGHGASSSQVADGSHGSVEGMADGQCDSAGAMPGAEAGAGALAYQAPSPQTDLAVGLLRHGAHAAPPTPQPPTAGQQGSAQGLTHGGVHGRWKRFDESVMQPIFGGGRVAEYEQLQSPESAQRAAVASAPAPTSAHAPQPSPSSESDPQLQAEPQLVAHAQTLDASSTVAYNDL